MKKLSLVLCILSLSHSAYATTAATTDFKGNAEAGQAKSALCAACHGPDGNSLAPTWPNLAGQDPNYIVDQLKRFKTGSRQDPTMAPMAMPLSEEDIHDLAAYFASLSVTVGQTSEESVKQGEKIYKGGNKQNGVPACAACHGPTGTGNPAAKYPAITGQKAEYTSKQLNDYKTGFRKPEGTASIMRDVALKLSDGEIKAVTDYMQALH